jgi:probable HAF family extracellular repeat protein
MHRHLLVAVVVILGVLLGERDVVQAASFTFTTLDVPGASTTSAAGINSRGQIVGFYFDSVDGSEHGFLYDAGVFTTIDVPLGAGTSLIGINARGQIVGDFSDGGMQRGFLDDAGVFTTLDVPFPDARGTLARGINPRGQIVGFYAVGPPEMADAPVHGFLYDAGVFTTLDVPGAIFTNPWGDRPARPDRRVLHR